MQRAPARQARKEARGGKSGGLTPVFRRIRRNCVVGKKTAAGTRLHHQTESRLCRGEGQNRRTFRLVYGGEFLQQFLPNA